MDEKIAKVEVASNPMSIKLTRTAKTATCLTSVVSSIKKKIYTPSEV